MTTSKVKFIPVGTKVKKIIPSEHNEQTRFVSHVRTFYPHLADLVAAVPNGGARSRTQGKRLKDEGLLPGYPDLIVDYPAHGFPGLRIETKRVEKGVISPEQRRIIRALRAAGYAVAVARGCDEALDILKAYLAGKTHPRLVEVI